jgi:hypothetical protein
VYAIPDDLEDFPTVAAKLLDQQPHALRSTALCGKPSRHFPTSTSLTCDVRTSYLRLMTKRIFTVRIKDLRPVDFVTGKRLPITRDEMKPCECCAKLCSKLSVLSTGHEVGSDCASAVELVSSRGIEKTDFGFFSVTKVQIAFARKLVLA